MGWGETVHRWMIKTGLRIESPWRRRWPYLGSPRLEKNDLRDSAPGIKVIRFFKGLSHHSQEGMCSETVKL